MYQLLCAVSKCSHLVPLFPSTFSPELHRSVSPLLQPGNMADSFYKLEDESFPSFLSKSLDSSSGRATLGNVTLGSGPGLPVAASTVAKIRPCSDNRWVHAGALDRCETRSSEPLLGSLLKEQFLSCYWHTNPVCGLLSLSAKK